LFKVYYTGKYPRKREVVALCSVALICTAIIWYVQITRDFEEHFKSRFWIIMIYFIQILHVFMYIQLAYEFLTYNNKLSMWEFQFLRDLELKKDADIENDEMTEQMREANIKEMMASYTRSSD